MGMIQPKNAHGIEDDINMLKRYTNFVTQYPGDQ